jgi:hypothetical protein
MAARLSPGLCLLGETCFWDKGTDAEGKKGEASMISEDAYDFIIAYFVVELQDVRKRLSRLRADPGA